MTNKPDGGAVVPNNDPRVEAALKAIENTGIITHDDLVRRILAAADTASSSPWPDIERGGWLPMNLASRKKVKKIDILSIEDGKLELYTGCTFGEYDTGGNHFDFGASSFGWIDSRGNPVDDDGSMAVLWRLPLPQKEGE